jgi:hypothetical protein
MARRSRGVTRVLQIGLIAVLLLPLVRLVPHLPGVDRPTTPRAGPAWDARNATMSRAAVFVPDPPGPISSLDLTRPLGDVRPLAPDGLLECRFVPEPVSGTTPKFDCELPNGEVVKVKYGSTPERHGEVAATRLLAALGFGADRVEFVDRLRCVGCPPMPFALAQLADLFMLPGLVTWGADAGRSRDFERVTVERTLPGRKVEVGDLEGWGFFELDVVDASAGGATREEVDALRLMAIFLAHWDNKTANQRLTCLDDPDGPKDATCATPLVMLQDVGATFGPSKADWRGWQDAPLWADAGQESCRVSMAAMPYNGGTFVPVDISEGGRQLLAGRLRQLDARQIAELFEAARFPDAGSGGDAGVEAWVALFLERVSRLADRPPCPSSS